MADSDGQVLVGAQSTDISGMRIQGFGDQFEHTESSGHSKKILQCRAVTGFQSENGAPAHPGSIGHFEHGQATEPAPRAEVFPELME